ncbi:SPOR domain-containing protein, partial [Thermus hydrothermalis]
APPPTPSPTSTPPSTPAEPVVTVIPLPKAPEASATERAAPEEKPRQEEKPRAASPAPAPTPTGAYRVVVGAFANPENALRLERELKAKGYPARLEAAGSLTRVVVGPYATEREASQVAQALAAYGARVYRGQGALPPAEGQVYLQVGAFQKEENALALVGKLKEMGLPVVLVKDGVYRVRVGPVAEGEKEAMKAKVEALGLTALEVR